MALEAAPSAASHRKGQPVTGSGISRSSLGFRKPPCNDDRDMRRISKPRSLRWWTFTCFEQKENHGKTIRKWWFHRISQDFMRFQGILWELPSGKGVHHYGKSPRLVGQLIMSMVMFNSYVNHYQRVHRMDDVPLSGSIVKSDSPCIALAQLLHPSFFPLTLSSQKKTSERTAKNRNGSLQPTRKQSSTSHMNLVPFFAQMHQITMYHIVAWYIIFFLLHVNLVTTSLLHHIVTFKAYGAYGLCNVLCTLW